VTAQAVVLHLPVNRDFPVYKHFCNIFFSFKDGEANLKQREVPRGFIERVKQNFYFILTKEPSLIFWG
jgi:hypothetical protein